MSRRAQTRLRGIRRLAYGAVRSAGLWAFLFVLTIPAMAVYYAALGEHSFRDSNLSDEPGFRADVSRLERGLTEALDAGLASRPGDRTESERFRVAELPRVSAVLPTLGAQNELSVFIEGVWNGSHGAAVLEGWFAISLGHEISITERGGRERIAFAVAPARALPAGVEHTTDDVPENVLFPHEVSFGVRVLEVPKRVAGELLNVNRGYEGDPAAASDELWRMVYFSATTITTLGLGDVQPVSDAARTAVTIEAALGILLAGLFLAALARRIVDERPRRRQE